MRKIAVALVEDKVPRAQCIESQRKAALLRRIAIRHGIPVHTNTKLAKRLSEIGSRAEIPRNTYEALLKKLGLDASAR